MIHRLKVPLDIMKKNLKSTFREIYYLDMPHAFNFGITNISEETLDLWANYFLDNNLYVNVAYRPIKMDITKKIKELGGRNV